MDEQTTPTIPAKLRTGLYVAGTFLGVGAAPALLALGYEPAAGVAAAFSGACNALAFGYRPTRTDA